MSQGLATSYEERGPGGVALAHTDYTWTTDSAGNAYVGTVLNTRNPGSGQVQSKSTQTLDTNGNLKQSAVYDYGNLATAAKTYNYTYLSDPNYASRHIMNRVTQVTVTVGGTVTTLVDNSYDTPGSGYSCTLGGLVSRSALMHDDANYGTGMTYRGNVSARRVLGVGECFQYETTGLVAAWKDESGRYLSSAPSTSTNYSLPEVLTPNWNANLATTMSYDSSWAVTSLTGPNGANGTTTYDGYGRPLSTKIPDGAVTTYTYATPTQQTATLGTGTAARWKRTTLDGFGRATKVETGNGPATNAAVSQVDTQYAPCACSPLGKVWRVSMPHAPSGNVAWTTYTYDGSGRTLTVTAPDGSVTHTEYLTAYGGYTGNLVRVTDPAGKWKIQQINALGQLIRVIEPNPAGGADWITNYTYDALGRLTDVWMPRSNGTQTRHFGYTGNNLTSATNPENGTVTYQYDASHHVTKRTDAKGQETRYTYDAYGRLTEVQHWAGSPLAELERQRVDYSYDSNPLNGSYSQNAWGRLTAVQFQDENTGTPFSYMYSYNPAGRVTAQRMNYNTFSGLHSFDGAYTWDNEGRMTGIGYGPPLYPQTYTFQYDANGRLGGMQAPDQYGNMTTLATATYGAAGETTGLNYFGYYETRTYDAMLQMTRMTASSNANNGAAVMDMQYLYGGANNGRITQSIDGIGGETLNYSYDAVNRLAGAGATNGSWGQAFTYDGFGNLTGKTVTAGSVPTLSVSFDPLTNHQYGVSYDANGNVVGSDLTCDVENRQISGGVYGAPESYVYDPSGKRVKKWKQDSEGMLQEEFLLRGWGQKVLTLTCQQGDLGMLCDPPKYHVYFGGKLVMSKGLAVVTDRLGSVRANAAGERMSYYPYGEERTSTADGREKFGTYTRDNPTQDYADQRYYSNNTGRFNTPNPSGMDAADLSDPGSWNMSAYAGNDPINFNDPEGLIKCSDAPRQETGQTFGDLINAKEDVGLLARVVWAESDNGGYNGFQTQAYFDEKAAVAVSIVNRWTSSTIRF